MTGPEFEKKFAEMLADDGFWVLNIPKNNYGAQAFDILAVKYFPKFRKDLILAVDCKVCSTSDRFPLSRIEDNQWAAFELLKKRTGAKIGIAISYRKRIFFYQYGELLFARNEGVASIVLNSNHLWGVSVNANDCIY